MLRNKYLNENRMFTNKVKCSIILDRKEKDLGSKRKELALIKSLIYAKLGIGAWRSAL